MLDDDDPNAEPGIDREALRQERLRKEREAEVEALEKAAKLREEEENVLVSKKTQMNDMNDVAASILSKYQ
jgi:hypothetical protein